MSVQSMTPEIRILPNVSGTVVSNIPRRTVITDNILTDVGQAQDDGRPVLTVLPNSVQEANDGSFFTPNGSISAAEVKFLYESNVDTNVYTDHEKYNIVANIDSRVDTEITDRQDADYLLTSLLLSEAENRISADENIYITVSGIQQNIPTALYQLTEDINHRITTDIEKEFWNEKLGPLDTVDGGLF